MYEGSVEETSNAIGALRQATQIAPGSARVWGMLAYAYMRQSLQAPPAERTDLRTRAEAAIQRAFALEPRQADALAAQVSGMRVFRNWYAVDRACSGALSQHPDNLGLLSAWSYFLMQVGRTREALAVLQKAAREAPEIAHLQSGVCVALWDLGRFDEADDALNRAMARWPLNFRVWFSFVSYRMFGGKPAEAAAMINDVGSRPVGIPLWNFDLMAAQANALASGDVAKVSEAVQLSARYARRGTGFAENAAIFAGFVGDFDTAFAILNALYFNRGFTMPDAYFTPEQGMYAGTERHTYNLFRWPLRLLRRDSRFAALARDLGLDDYWRRTGTLAHVTR